MHILVLNVLNQRQSHLKNDRMFKKIETYFITALVCLIFSVEHKSKVFVHDEIAYIEKERYVFIIDTLKYKSYLERVLNLPNVSFDKVEIRKDSMTSNHKNVYYMLIAYDWSEKLKTAHYLLESNNRLYFYKNPDNRQEEINEIFYSTYFTCYGTDENCFPVVVEVEEGVYEWSGSPYLVCDPLCTAMRSLVIEN